MSGHHSVLARGEAVARGREAELSRCVVIHVRREGELLLHAVVEGEDFEARVAPVSAVYALTDAERVMTAPIQVHLAGEEEVVLKGILRWNEAQRGRIEGSDLGEVTVQHPAIETRLFAMEGGHRDVESHLVIPLPLSVDLDRGGGAPVVGAP